MSFMPSAEAETLLSQLGWMRTLACRLLSNRDDAEDAVQAALLKAWEKGPSDPRRLKSWLFQVLRHDIFRRWQNAKSGLRREVRDASPENLVDFQPVDPLEQAESQRLLLDALLALPDPYRRVLLSRYVSGHPPKVIAEMLQVPESTVRTQLSRGVELLRDSLRGSYGDDWQLSCLALLGLRWAPIAPSAGGATETTMAAVQSSSWKVAGLVTAGISVVALATAGLWPSLSSSPSSFFGSSGTNPSARVEQSRLSSGSAAVQGPAASTAGLGLAAERPSFPSVGSVAPAQFGGGILDQGSGQAVIQVKALGPNGMQLAQAAQINPTRLGVIALEQPLSGLLQVLEDSNYNNLGYGYLRRGTVFELPGNPSLPPDVLGALVVQNPPAEFEVYLLYENFILAHAHVTASATDLEFRVDPLLIEVKQTGLHFQVYDALTSSSTVAGLTANLYSGASWRQFDLTGTTGVVDLLDLDPGWHLLDVRATDRARVVRMVRIPGGSTLDLGTLTLGSSVEISGVVRDAAGSPLAGATVAALELGPPETFLRRLAQATALLGSAVDGQGVFRFRDLSAGQYLVWVKSTDFGRVAPQPRIVDTSSGVAATGIELRVDAGTAVAIRPQFDKLTSRFVWIENAGQTTIWASRLIGTWEYAFSLVPGSYLLHIGSDPALPPSRTEALTVGGDPIVVDLSP